MSFENDLRERFALLAKIYPGFDEVLTQALFALVAEEHMLWYSKPGRAKSMVARAIFDIFPDAPTFSIQLTKDMMPDSVFGSVIPKELIEEGKEIFNLDGGIVESVFVYGDEFFDAPDFLLRAMLNVLNEREFKTKDMGTIKAPLHSMIATTNYIRQREATEAVLDRLLCKAVLPGVTDVTDVMRAGQTYLGFAGKSMHLSPLSYGDLRSLADHVQRPECEGGVVISSGMRLLHVLLVHEFQRRRREQALATWHEDPVNKDKVDEPTEVELGVPDVSPRTLVKLHDMSRAAAALSERNDVHPVDQRALGYGLYVIGDSSGDGEIWHTLCDEFLKFTPKELKALEALGGIADELGTIKSEHLQVNRAMLHIGGNAVTAVALAAQGLSNFVRGVRHPVVSLAQKQLESELLAFTRTPQHDGFNLLQGWQ